MFKRELNLKRRACLNIKQVLSLKTQARCLMIGDVLRVLLFFFLVISSSVAMTSPLFCREVLSNRSLQILLSEDKKTLDEHQTKTFKTITANELSEQASLKMLVVPEFQFIREEAEKRGIRVWLFGGTASSYLHYVKWNLAREKGLNQLQADRFDFDYTNIFRSTQDLDIVVDGTSEEAREFQKTIAKKFPHFLGAKAAKWEVRALRTRMGNPGEIGYKEALLGDDDFSKQNSDSNSLGMVEVTHSKEPVVRDLRHWDAIDSPFLQDALNDRISFFRSADHFTTSRAKTGQNPEILSVTRLLVKAFQYELKFSEKDFKLMKSIVDHFDPQQLQNPEAQRRLEDTAKKLIMHATNIEYAMNMLDELGLRKKLIEMGDKNKIDSMSWWLNREPLRSKSIGRSSGQTAKELGIEIVAHETNNFFAYESITRAHSGEPNVLESRENTFGERAALGKGFYTRQGRKGATSSGLTIRFTVDPNAREGSIEEGGDFTCHEDFILFHNKKALSVIPESLNFSLNDLIRMAESQEFEVDHSDLALVEKFKRKLNVTKITDELQKLIDSGSEEDFDQLAHILSMFQTSVLREFIPLETYNLVVRNVYFKIEAFAKSNREQDIIHYIKTLGPIKGTLEDLGLLKKRDFLDYLDHVSTAPGASLQIWKAAVFEKLLFIRNFEGLPDLKKLFSNSQLVLLRAEIGTWRTSKDERKRKFSFDQNLKWQDAIKNGDVKKLEALIGSGIVDINHKNANDYSALMIAAYHRKDKLIDWLIQHPDFDLFAKNNQGFNQIEQLQRLGKNELVNKIARARRDIQVSQEKVPERNKDGSPIIDFVPIEPKSFMRDSQAPAFVTLTKPFEIMSVATTRNVWGEIAEVLKSNYPREYDELNSDPSYFKGELPGPKWKEGINKLSKMAKSLAQQFSTPSFFRLEGGNRPVEQVSYYDVMKWFEGLNKLSLTNNDKIQSILLRLFPGHRKGHFYRLPTEAEYEFALRNQGLADGYYSIGNLEEDLEASAWTFENSDKQTHPVGQKKPTMINGKPVYDLQGNITTWVTDAFTKDLSGGIDPQALQAGREICLRGGSMWDYNAYLFISFRRSVEPSYLAKNIGFRIVRDKL